MSRLPAYSCLVGMLIPAILTLSGGPSRAAGPRAQEVLAAADAVRNPAEPFQVSIALLDYRARKENQASRIQVYARMEPGRGQYDTLVRFLEPSRERHKLLLKTGNEIWFFDRSTRAGVRLSAHQRILGQVSNGDVVTVNLARDYAASLAGEEQILDGDRKERSCLKLRLAATHPEAVYHRIEYWVEKGTHHPIKGTFHSDSGRLLKTAYFRKYERHMGRLRPTEIVIVDGLDPQWVTLMHFSGYHPRTIPDAWFRLDGLPTFNE